MKSLTVDFQFSNFRWERENVGDRDQGGLLEPLEEAPLPRSRTPTRKQIRNTKVANKDGT